MSRRLPLALVLTVLLPGADAIATDLKNSPEVEAITRDFTLVDLLEEDVDGDGTREGIVVFDDPGEGGGILVMQERHGTLTQAACLYTHGFTVKALKKEGKSLVMDVAGADGKVDKLPITLGKELALRGRPGDPMLDMKVTASSSLTLGKPQNAVDGDLETAWIEGGDGTGIGESITFEFKKGVSVALVGIYPGDGRGPKPFKDANRIRKATVEASSSQHVGDVSAGLDFADLGIEASGPKTEAAFANRPEMKFVRINEEDVVRLLVRIDSVYLGDKKNDTHVAEVNFCLLLTDAQIKSTLRKLGKR